jgi:hypothetical protein
VIDLGTTRPLLARFVEELDAQAPISLAGAVPDLRPYAAGDVETARLAWASRIVDEYTSVVMFSQLLGLLAEARAPYAALCAVQRLIGDELRHTRLCADVAGWLGGLDDLEIDLDGLGLPSRDDPPGGRALEVVVRELCVAEGASVHMLRALRAATDEPAVRQALSLLLKDEVRHAATGRRLAELLVASLPAEETASVRARLPALVAEDRARLREIYRGMPGAPGRALGATLHPDEVPRL